MITCLDSYSWIRTVNLIFFLYFCFSKHTPGVHNQKGEDRGGRGKNSVRIAVRKIAVRKIAVRKIGLRKVAVRKMAFRKMAVRKNITFLKPKFSVYF